jgi:hypothetical protein
MTPKQIELMKQAARNLLAHRKAGRKCDRDAIRWAEQLLKNNPKPYNPPADTDEEKAKLP